jgi:hypothetical protein
VNADAGGRQRVTDEENTQASEEESSATEEEGSENEEKSPETEEDEAKEEMRKIEEDPPDSLEDWPQGKAKYETYGGPEGEHGYHEGPEQKLGPSAVRHHEGGEVTVEGEKVDNPEEYKGDPIPGGPTDPNAPNQPGERDLQKEENGDSDDE